MNVQDVDPRTLVPHAGEMCLIARIVSATEDEIVCATDSHRSPANPLRRGSALAALHLAEYGAQVMAIHGGLRDGQPRRGGMLVAIRDLVLRVERLDDLAGELTIRARRLLASGGGLIYAFEASAAGRELGAGRVSVMFAV